MRPETCSKCYEGETIQAHHEDYTKPLEVDWLCPMCHKAADMKRATRLKLAVMLGRLVWTGETPA